MKLALSIIRAELRGKKTLFLLAASSMGMAALVLTLVLSLSNSFEHSLNTSSQTLLGGDVSVRLSQRDFSAEELHWLKKNSKRHSKQFSARMLAIAKDKSYLTQLRAVDNHYPLFGAMQLRSGQELTTALTAPTESGVYPALVAKELLVLLDIQVGDRFDVGGLNLQVVDVVEKEPDPNLRLWLSAPLVMVSDEVLIAGELNQLGTLLDRYMKVDLAALESPQQWQDRLLKAFPDAGWSIKTSDNATPSLRSLMNNIRDFLALVSLAAMLIAGIGVGGAVSSFLLARTRRIAVLKIIGGDARLVRTVYFGLTMTVAITGAVIGTFIGQSALFVIAPMLTTYLPVELEALWSWPAIGQTLLSASLMSAVFTLPPIMRFARINPITLFHAGMHEDDVPSMNITERVLTVSLALLAIFFLPLEWREKGLAFGVLIVAAILIMFSQALGAACGQLANKTRPPLSWGLLFLSRNRRQTTACALSFGIGLAALAAIVNVQGNFKDRIDDTLRREAPGFYLVGVREQQMEKLRQQLKAVDKKARLQTTPFLRGRITHLGEKPAAEIEAPENLAWILRSDRGITWTTDGEYIGNSKVVEGHLWDAAIPTPQVSFDAEAGRAFGLNIGDTIRLNILGRPYEAHISNFREIEWGSFDINFVMIFSEQPFGNVPHSYLGVAFLPPEKQAATQLALAKNFPNITPIATGVLFDAAKSLLTLIGAILSVATLLLLIGGIPVIIASLAEGHERRLKDSATMRLVGASQKTIMASGLIELTATATTAVLPAIFFGMTAGWLIIKNIFDLAWQPRFIDMALLGTTGVLVFLAAGAFSLILIAKQSPFALIRNE